MNQLKLTYDRLAPSISASHVRRILVALGDGAMPELRRNGTLKTARINVKSARLGHSAHEGPKEISGILNDCDRIYPQIMKNGMDL
jgi:hypothetical protein